MASMVAQSEDPAVAAISILFVLALLGLQIYLVYAIIATRGDVKAIRRRLQPEFGSPPSAFQEMASSPSPAPRTGPQAASGPVYAVHLLGAGSNVYGVRQVLTSQLGYGQTDAAVAAVSTGERVMQTRDRVAAEWIVQAIHEAGGSAEIRATGVVPADPASGQPTPSVEAEQSDLKTCPDCAELVKVAAKKCRFCGFRFDDSESNAFG